MSLKSILWKSPPHDYTENSGKKEAKLTKSFFFVPLYGDCNINKLFKKPL